MRSSNLTLKPEYVDKASKIPRHQLQDITGPLGLHSIFADGKFSNKVTQHIPEMKVRASVSGLKEFFVRMPNRIMVVWGEFFVRGLGNKIVSVSNPT